MADVVHSQLTTLLKAHAGTQAGDSSNTRDHHLLLALQIRHNLEFQHRWTNLQLHRVSPLTGERLERPLLSGLPPRRIYVNPDEQVEHLRQDTARKKQQKLAASSIEASAESATVPEGETALKPEVEWVFPAHLREEWTMARFGSLFDSIGSVPPALDAKESANQPVSKWRTTKRALLATLQDDSTVVYYFVHDGIVKPRQN